MVLILYRQHGNGTGKRAHALPEAAWIDGARAMDELRRGRHQFTLSPAWRISGSTRSQKNGSS